MKINTAGLVTEDFQVLGIGPMPVYMLNGRQPVLFDSGLTCLAPAYLRDIKEALGARAPGIMFITHMHFDHCGGVSEFKKAYPGLEIAASEAGAVIIERPNAVKLITELNRKVAARFASDLAVPDFQPFTVDRRLKDGDRVELEGGLSVEVIATPGHTRDFLSYYIPQKKILIASEAVGVAQSDGRIVTEFLVDYDAYVDSMKRLDKLPVEVLCQGHHWVYTDGDAKAFIKRSLAQAEKYRAWVLRLLDQEHGEIEKVMARVKASEYDNSPGPRQDEKAYLLNLQARVTHLAQTAWVSD